MWALILFEYPWQSWFMQSDTKQLDQYTALLGNITKGQ